MKYLLALIVIALAIAGIAFSRKQMVASSSKQSQLQIEDKVSYALEVVSDPITQARGLSGRESLPEDTGMLFVFSRPKVQHFWMKEMHFPIDVVWIRDFTIIGFSESVLPPSETGGEIARMSSVKPADMVLELNAGQVQANGLNVGDMVKIDLIEAE